MSRAAAFAALLASVLALGCDDAPGYPRPVGAGACSPEPLQYAPCDPYGDGCGAGQCALQSGPYLAWACELREPGQDPGEPCDRHGQCSSGVCLPLEIAPYPSSAADYGACAAPCQAEADCPGDSWCHPVGGEGSAAYSVCVYSAGDQVPPLA